MSDLESVLVACPTRGQVWYETASVLPQIAFQGIELGYAIDVRYVRSKMSCAEGRNRIRQLYMEGDYQACLMLDDDVVPEVQGALSIIGAAVNGVADIVTIPCPLLRPGLPVLLNLYRYDEDSSELAFEVQRSMTEEGLQPFDAVGMGCVAFSDKMMRSGGIFRDVYDDNGLGVMDEGIDYCLRAAADGAKIASDLDFVCEHMLYVHGNAVAHTYLDMLAQGIAK